MQVKGATISLCCKVVGISTATYYKCLNHPEEVDGRTLRKDYAPGKLAFTEKERQNIIDRYNQPDVRDLSIKQAFYKLLDQGEYLGSESTVRRVFKQYKVDARTRRDHIRNSSTKGYKPKALTASRPNEVWSWDGTPFRDRWGNQTFILYVIIDIYSRKIVHHDVFTADSTENAVKFLRDAFERNQIKPGQLALHSDNGAPMRAEATLKLLETWGVEPSHSRPRVSNDNPFSESAFATINIRMGGDLKRYSSLEDCRQHINLLIDRYNHSYHSGINFCTPEERHAGRDQLQLERRRKVLEEQRKLHPNRWISQKIMNCEQAGVQYLNPSDKQDN